MDLEELARVDLPGNVFRSIQTGRATEWHNGVEEDAGSRYLYDSDGVALRIVLL